MDHKPAVIAISSHVARGSVGNRAVVFALEVLGHGVWAVPSVILPWHPGHGKGTRIVAPAEEFAALLEDLGRAPWLGEVGAILSGYLGDPSQAKAIADLVGVVKQQNPKVIFACDPVIGDEAGLYVSDKVASAVGDHLLPIADLITPNRFELAWLTGQGKFAGNEEIIAAASQLGRPITLVTSAISMMRNSTGNILLTSTKALMAEHSFVENAPNGLGDLTAALFLARYLQDLPLETALQATTASVFEILARAARHNADELMLETDQASLLRPTATVQMRNLLVAPTKAS